MRSTVLLPLMVAAGLATSAVGAPQTFAQPSTPTVTCRDLAIPLGSLPADTVMTFTLTADNLIQQCQSTTGAPLTLVSPKGGITVNPKPNSQQTIPFTVTDSNGNKATANVVVTRS